MASLPFEKKFRFTAFTIGLAAVLLFLLLVHLPPVRSDLYTPLDLGSSDLLLRSLPLPPPQSDIVVLSLDDISESILGSYPWPLYRYLHLLEILSTLGPKAILFTLPLPSISKAESPQENPEQKSDQEEMERTLKNLGNVFWIIPIESFPSSISQPLDSGQPQRDAPTPPKHPTSNVQYHSSTFPQVGLTHFQADLDGYVRQIPLLTFQNHHVYPHLVLTAYTHLYQRSWELTPLKTLLLNPKKGSSPRSSSLTLPLLLPIVSSSFIHKADAESLHPTFSLLPFSQLYQQSFALNDQYLTLFLPFWENAEKSLGLSTSGPSHLESLAIHWQDSLSKASLKNPTPLNTQRLQLLSYWLPIIRKAIFQQEEEIRTDSKRLQKLMGISALTAPPSISHKTNMGGQTPVAFFSGKNGEFTEKQLHLQSFYNAEHSVHQEMELRRLLAGWVQNKICLIGVTNPRHSAFFVKTPFHGWSPSVLLQADALDTLINQTFVHPVHPWLYHALAFLLGLGTVLLSSLMILNPFTLLLPLLGMGTLSLAIPLFLLRSQSVLMGFVLPLGASGFGFLAVITYRLLVERRKRQEVQRLFQHYTTPEALQELLADPSKVAFEGERKFATAFFSDLQGFTAFAEQHEPEMTIATLNRYLKEITEALFQFHGFLDKYEGDGVVACFGIPLGRPTHAQEACLAALEVQDRIHRLGRRLRQEGISTLAVRIGLATGPIVVGNVGSENRFDYTLIGDPVNLASRLEEANKVLGTQILISETTRRLAKESIITRDLGWIRVRGRLQSIRVYELVDTWERRADHEEWLQTFHDGLQAYSQRNWDRARTSFEQALRLHPGDRVSALFLQQCHTFQDQPPPQDWDQTYAL